MSDAGMQTVHKFMCIVKWLLYCDWFWFMVVFTLWFTFHRNNKLI